MSEEVSLPPDLMLPASVVSKADVARLAAELERIDSDLSTNTVRAKVGASTFELDPADPLPAGFSLR